MTSVDDAWVKSNSPLSPQTMHALGVLTFKWNMCEYWTNAIFGQTFSLSEADAKLISGEMNTSAIWDRIITGARRKAFSDELKDHLAHAAKQFDICRVNRNTYVHAQGALASKPRLSLTKAKRQELFGLEIPDDVTDIRRVVDDVSSLRRYLESLCIWMHEPDSASSPQKQALPRLVERPSPRTVQAR